MEDKELLKHIKTWKTLKMKKKEVEAQLQEIEVIIKEDMKSRQLEELQLSTYTIRYQSITSYRFDTNAFKLTHKDLYTQYTKPTTNTRFTII